MSRAKKPIRRVTRPPTLPPLFWWKKVGLDPNPNRRRSFQAVFTPEQARQMLTEAKAPGGPNYADLRTAVDYLNRLAAEIREPPLPRAEAIADWAEETATAAWHLLRGFGVDPKLVADGSAALTPKARQNLDEALLPMITGPLSDRVRRGDHLRAPLSHRDAIALAIDSLAFLAWVTDDAAGWWRRQSKGAGANKKEATHKLAIHGAAAYRAATGKEPGLNPGGPFARFLAEIVNELCIDIEAGAAVAAWRREAKRNR